MLCCDWLDHMCIVCMLTQLQAWWQHSGSGFDQTNSSSIADTQLFCMDMAFAMLVSLLIDGQTDETLVAPVEAAAPKVTCFTYC